MKLFRKALSLLLAFVMLSGIFTAFPVTKTLSTVFFLFIFLSNISHREFFVSKNGVCIVFYVESLYLDRFSVNGNFHGNITGHFSSR